MNQAFIGKGVSCWKNTLKMFRKILYVYMCIYIYGIFINKYMARIKFNYKIPKHLKPMRHA